MFSRSARLYDAIYGSIRDYPREAAELDRLIQERRPGARTLLDVACGTGAHLEHLGVEIEPLHLVAAGQVLDVRAGAARDVEQRPRSGPPLLDQSIELDNRRRMVIHPQIDKNIEATTIGGALTPDPDCG